MILAFSAMVLALTVAMGVVGLTDDEPPVADAGDDVTINQGETVIFNGTGSTDNVFLRYYNWSFEYDDLLVFLTKPITSFRFSVPGIYMVTLNVTDGVGLWDTDEVVITVLDNEAPKAMAGSDRIVDQHTDVRLDASASTDNVAITNWTWTFTYGGEEHVRQTIALTFTFDVVGDYPVTLRVADAAGNWAETTVIITVFDTDPPVADAGPDITVDTNEEVDFSSAGCWDNVGIYLWLWEFMYLGHNMTLRGPNPSFIFDEVGTYTVYLRVEDEVSNFAEDELQVTVRDVEPPVAMIKVDYQVDQNTTCELNGTLSMDNVAIESWEWRIIYGERVDTHHGALVNYLYKDAGQYLIYLIVADAEGNDNMTSVTVKARDTEAPVAVPGGELVVRKGRRAILDGRASSDNVGIVNWTWTLQYGGRTYRGYGSEAVFDFEKAGFFSMILTVRDEAGLQDTASFQVTVGNPEKTEDEPSGTIWWGIAGALMIVGVVAGLWLLRRPEPPEPPLAVPHYTNV
jgi:PKD repeat protein